MGKHKHKGKSKKLKHKKSKHEFFGNSNSEDCQIVWTEKVDSKNDESVPINNELTSNSESTSIQINEDEDFFEFLTKTSRSNSKQTKVEKNKKDAAIKEEKIRYSRELNSYYRDVNKKFDNVDDLNKIHMNNKDVTIVSNSEMNNLNAQLIKAEMLGNIQVANELKEKLKQLQQKRSDSQIKLVNKSIKQMDYVSENKMSVKELFLKTKSISAHEEAMRFVASTSKIKSTDDEYEDVRMKKKAKFDLVGFDRFGFNNSDEDKKCDWCVEKFSKHLLLKFSYDLSHCFVALTPYKPFIPNVCQIICRNHSARCSLEADHECWNELRQVMRTLSSFFDQYFNCAIVFMETFFMNKKRNQNTSSRHFVIECVPIKKRFYTDAKIFFHKAIIESGEEWSINRKLIKLEKHSITRKLPKGLAYFWVSIGPEFDGYGHVIEDEDYFDKNFGKQVIEGLYDDEMESSELKSFSRPEFENFDTQIKRVKEFKNKWRNFID